MTAVEANKIRFSFAKPLYKDLILKSGKAGHPDIKVVMEIEILKDGKENGTWLNDCITHLVVGRRNLALEHVLGVYELREAASMYIHQFLFLYRS